MIVLTGNDYNLAVLPRSATGNPFVVKRLQRRQLGSRWPGIAFNIDRPIQTLLPLSVRGDAIERRSAICRLEPTRAER